MNEQLLNRLAQDRSRELAREASAISQLSGLRLHWRDRLARKLFQAANRLARSEAGTISASESAAGAKRALGRGQRRQLAGH